MSTEAVVTAVREAVAARTPLRICGRSNWLDAGRPVRANKPLSLRDDTGVVSYVPGDLTLTVRGGTPLAEIDRVTREHDQWLPLDPYGSSDGSIGATIATASPGPLATHFGLPRDLVLGLEFVTGRGDVVRSGGKVVKNVAGFDLSRLLTGSWGTLGVITEVTLRLYARPKVEKTLVVKLRGSDKDLSRLLRALSAAPVMPYAMELLSTTAAHALDLGEQPVCLLRLGGNPAVVDAQAKAVAALASVEEKAGEVWDELRMLECDGDEVIRISGLPSQLLSASAAILTDGFPGVYSYINLSRGVMRLATAPRNSGDMPEMPNGISSVDIVARTERPNEGVMYEKLPPEVWPLVAPSVVSDPLSQGIKKAYDPDNILNPGILGD